MASEVELHDAIQELRSVATAPDLYPILVELESIASLLGLLSHDNADVSVAVVDLLQEMTDVDTLHESVEGTAALVQSLSDNQVTFFKLCILGNRMVTQNKTLNN
jgi:beta-catenin-like protein 1